MIKTIFLIGLSLLNYQILFSQSFELHYATKYDEIPWDAIELDDGDFIILTQRNIGGVTSLDCNIQLYKVSTEGVFIDSLIFNSPPKYQLDIARYIHTMNDNQYLVVGNITNIETQDIQLYLFWFDEALNFISDTIIGDTVVSDFYPDHLINDEGNLIAGGSFRDTCNHSIIMEYDFNTKIITKSHLRRTCLSTTIIEVSSSNSYHLFGWSAADSMTIVDRDSMKILTRMPFPLPFSPSKAVNIPSSTDYLVAGKAVDTVTWEWNLIYRRMDSTGHILEESYYGQEDTAQYFAINELDCNSIGYFYLGGSHNITSIMPLLYPERRWILVNKLNMDGSIIWQHYYKGDLHYMPMKVLATEDGGALILSHKYDWNSPYPNQRDIHILKVDSNGYYPGMVNIDELTGKPQQILVYPNPAKSWINIITGYYNFLELYIYDVQGHIRMQKTLHGSIHKLNIESFSPGMYIYEFRNDDGFAETGKLIVQ